MEASISSLEPLAREFAKLLVAAIRDEMAGVAGDRSATMLPSDVAMAMKVSPKRIYEWIKSGRLSAANLQSDPEKRPRYVIDRKDFDNFRAGMKPPPKVARRRRKVQSSFKRY